MKAEKTVYVGFPLCNLPYTVCFRCNTTVKRVLVCKFAGRYGLIGGQSESLLSQRALTQLLLFVKKVKVSP
jgi:hypothetical protein